METLSARVGDPCPVAGSLALLDLTQLKPLLKQDNPLFAFLLQLLSPAEAKVFSRYTYHKRRLEWFGGRLAAKYCLRSFLEPDQRTALFYQTISLLSDPSGRPCLEQSLAGQAIPSVSISHSSQYAAALTTAAGRCGIDIQKKAQQLLKVQDRFTTQQEIALLHPIPDHLSRLTTIWAIKEAVKKGFLHDKSSFLGGIHLVEFTRPFPDGNASARCALDQARDVLATVYIAEMDDYVIACTTGEHHA